MERDTHYFVVGLFIIVTSLAGALFAGLFYDRPSAATHAYAVHFDIPVEGLEVGNEVRFMGIKKGEVTRVFLLPDNPAKVGVEIAVEQDTPVNTATEVVLRLQGLTSVPFLNLEQKMGVTPAPFPVKEGGLPVLPTKLTAMDALVQSLPNLEKELATLIQSANAVLNEENRQHFAAILQNLDTVSAGLPALADSLQASSEQLQTLIKQVNGTVSRSEQGLAVSMKELQATLVAIRTTSQRLDTLLRDVDRVVVNNEGKVNELLGEGGENLKQLLNESRKTVAAVRQLSDKLEQNPSQILYQSAPQGTVLPP